MISFKEICNVRVLRHYIPDTVCVKAAAMTTKSVPYKEAFPKGSRVCVADRAFLERFMAEWKFHHKLQREQLAYADREATVRGVGFYHGGDAVYSLEGVPGTWLEPCLRGVGGNQG